MNEQYCDPAGNKWLKLRNGVIRTPQTDMAICALDCFFASFYTKPTRAEVSSIKRTPQRQLSEIISLAQAAGLQTPFSFTDLYSKDEKNNYVWQYAWSHLLERGVIVNPPLAATVLYDYYSEWAGKQMKGEIIQPSVHILGNAFDITHPADSPDDNVESYEELVKFARIVDDLLKACITQILYETKNNCVHVSVKPLQPVS